MEKYSQFRDRGSGISPFLPIATQPSGISLPLHAFLFTLRVPILLAATLTYLLFFSWTPTPSLVKKAALWCILAIPGIWWMDLQIDGVKRGDLGRQVKRRLPQPGSIIVSSFTSPIDALYLAAVFDPIFTASYPNTRLVQRISLAQAILRAFLPPRALPPDQARLVDLAYLIQTYPDQPIVVQPECTTTNGRGILPLSTSLLTAPPYAKIFPTSLRYSPADITTPVPSTYITFMWNLCSKPTHTIRVRIADCVYNTAAGPASPKTASPPNSYSTNFLDTLQASETLSNDSSDTLLGSEDPERLGVEERRLLEKVGEALARLGRVKRVGLGVAEKKDFIKLWTRRRG